jgi:HK97 family phage prohead protease
MPEIVKPLHKGFVQSFEVKDIDSKSGFFRQAYTRYDVKDSDEDRGRKGMFTKTWRENAKRIRHLLNHDTDRPVGEPQKLWEDNEYAYIDSQLGTNNDGEDFKKMVESNLIKEASYGYTVIKSNKLKDGSNELLEVKLWEVSSLTGWGANEFTPVISFVKGMNKSDLFEDYLQRLVALESFCKNSTATDHTLQKLELERDQIKSFLKTLLTNGTEAEPVSLQPQLNDGVLDIQIKAFSAMIEIQKQLLTA